MYQELNVKLTPIVIAQIFQSIVECIDSIKSFNAGYEFNSNQLEDIKYPTLFLEAPQAWSYRRTEMDITIGFQILNRAPEGQFGAREGDDVMRGIFQTITNEQYRLESVFGVILKELQSNIPAQFDYTVLPIYEGYEDRVFGVRCDITFKSKYTIDYCNQPKDDQNRNCISFAGITETPFTPTVECPEYGERLTASYGADTGNPTIRDPYDPTVTPSQVFYAVFTYTNGETPSTVDTVTYSDDSGGVNAINIELNSQTDLGGGLYLVSYRLTDDGGSSVNATATITFNFSNCTAIEVLQSVTPS